MSHCSGTPPLSPARPGPVSGRNAGSQREGKRLVSIAGLTSTAASRLGKAAASHTQSKGACARCSTHGHYSRLSQGCIATRGTDRRGGVAEVDLSVVNPRTRLASVECAIGADAENDEAVALAAVFQR